MDIKVNDIIKYKDIKRIDCSYGKVLNIFKIIDSADKKEVGDIYFRVRQLNQPIEYGCNQVWLADVEEVYSLGGNNEEEQI